MPDSNPTSSEPIEGLIQIIRGRKVILDTDLAALYGVTTFRFNEAVKRNIDRFPSDFRFQITHEELANLLSQIAMSKGGHGGRRFLPWAFTEYGALMAANVLQSPRAIEMSLFVIRAFVKIREEHAANASILQRLAEIDQTLLKHDSALRDLYQKLRPLLTPPADPLKPRIGFHPVNH